MILTFGVDFLQWLVVDDHHLEKIFDFDDFATALSSLPSALPAATTTGTLAPKQTAWELGPDTSDPIARGAARVKGGLPCSQQAVLVVCCL